MDMTQRETWEKFRDCKLLWWVNRLLHTFGWAICYKVNDAGEISDVYPARVKFRGFSENVESDGFIGLTQHISETIPELLQEAKE